MEENTNSFTSIDIPGERAKPIMLVARLMQEAASMRHIDEVFFWLAQSMQQHLNIAVVQVLTIQRDSAGQISAELHAAASQNPSLARIDFGNNQVTAIVEQVFYKQQEIISRPVESLFPPQQASLFVQNNLHYWASYFLRSNASLPSTPAERAAGKTSVPLNVIVSLFTLYPLSTDQIRAIRFILEQAMRIISNRGFLTQPAISQPSISQPATSQPATSQPATLETAASKNADVETLLAHAGIIPRKSENIEQFQANNPFARASIIADKNARRLYTAIDGSKNLAELAQATSLGPKEMLAALHYLFEQQKIHFYTLKGEFIQKPAFISPHA